MSIRDWHRAGMDPRWTKPVEEHSMRNQEFKGVLSWRGMNGIPAPVWATAVSRLNGVWYFEESPHQRLHDRFQAISDRGLAGAVRQYSPRSHRGFDYYYDLPPLPQVVPVAPPAAPIPAEEVPPIAQHLMYVNASGERKIEIQEQGNDINICVSTFNPISLHGNAPRRLATGAVITPETALALASDLIRMAMQQRRKVGG